MWIKVVNICILIAVVHADFLYDIKPYAHAGEYAAAYDNYKPTDYKFEYGVSDPHTGDHKSQWEVMENGVVRGAYSLLEPDGTTRIVEYYADDTGFHADVKKIGTAVHDAPHYATLHPIADAHIANSLAYNGYGHGGITHSYGAPIAVVPKIASSIPQPVHAAPVAHIAATPQLIAPQIHHVGSPYDVPYAPEPAPLLHNPSPFQLPTPLISKSHESPIISPPVPFVSKSYPEPIINPPIVSKVYQPPIQLHPNPIYPKNFHTPILTKTYPPLAIPDPYYVPTVDRASVGNPLSKYLFIPAPKVGAQIVPAQSYDYLMYNGYKPEVVLSMPHNYAAYDYNDY